MITIVLRQIFLTGIILFSVSTLDLLIGQGFEGYYQYPSIHKNKLVFAAEGDIWTVGLTGGIAQRITTHPEEESNPIISPDGSTIAYSASHEGPTEIYTVPISGGIPTRWTYESDFSLVNGWTPDGKIVYDTRAYATLPERQLVTIDTKTFEKHRIPLNQASEACFDSTGKTVFFVRPAYHRNVTKRYKGGTARQIWKYTEGNEEAIKLTTDYAGESHHPMWSNGRIYFITDRDGTMNVWSMDENGKDLKQHTYHEGFDVRYATISENDIVYQLGADIWHYDIKGNKQNKISITLMSDLDQLQEKWEDNPSQYISSVFPDKEGDKVVITARGRIFVAPAKTGRMVEFTDKSNVRYRDAIFSADGKNIYTLSDESGEFEFASLPANGIGNQKQITKDGKVLRYGGKASPDGKWMVYGDIHDNVYVLNINTGLSQKISTNDQGTGSASWSPDSKWVAFEQSAFNTMVQIHIYNVDSQKSFPLTSDRANSLSPCWSPDGQFIYFLSDRSFTSLVGAPWGPRQPEPYFDANEKIYHISLKKGTRSPFRPNDELNIEKKETTKKEKDPDNKTEIIVSIDQEGIMERIEEVSVKAGNYRGLKVSNKALYFVSRETGIDAKTHLAMVKITNEDPKVETILEEINSFELTENKEKILVRKQGNYYMIEASTSKISDLNSKKIDLKDWRFKIEPREDWKQLFTDAWRMERDYFYDENMHGVNWKGMHEKYFPLTDRITTREELSDLIGRFVGELSALHTSVRGGDTRDDNQNITVANLGALLKRDASSGGYLIEHIYKADPDYPDEKSPLDDPYLDIKEGDVIININGRSSLDAIDIGELIRNQGGKQVLVRIKRNGVEKDVIVVPINNAFGLRYRDWEYSRRMEVEKKAESKIGYVHLQAMGGSDLEQWYKEFYPVFDRQGLIIDVRNNRGGNIESFILEKLLRKAWMYWKSRSGKPYWNMQYAFTGHIVVLVNENTASDGEAFADGFKRLNLGTAIGTRTWGGEIWLSGSNTLSDGGIARAPMNGVYGPEGEWLIEGHGFEPDVVVDNLPHATFNGEDAQLNAAIDYLKKLIKEDPREVTPVPPHPDKSFKN